MKNFALGLIALTSIAIGVWFGTQNQPQQQAQSNGYDDLGGEFTLQSTKGDLSLSDLRGKVVPIYFGYTHCPDVCITSLSKLATAMKTLSQEQRAGIQPVFITVDPERDTAQKSQQYAEFFYPGGLGLSGSVETIAEIAKRYFVIYEKVAIEGSEMDYAVDHSSIIYVVGKDGKIKSLVHHADTAEALAKYLQEALTS